MGEVPKDLREAPVLENQDLAGVPAEAFLLDLGSIDTDSLHELLQKPDIKLLGLAQPCLDEFHVEGGPVRGTLPLTRLDIVAGHDVHDDSLHACLGVGMLRVLLPVRIPSSGLETNLQADLLEARFVN